MFLPITQGGHSVVSDITLEITSSASDVNILTLATAAGYDATTDTAITVNINNGVTLSGSSGAALNTGALNAASNLTINLLSGSFVHGFTGTTGSPGAGQAGGTGGDAIVFGTMTGSGSATYEVNVNSGATLGGGSGGGGSGGSGGQGVKTQTCYDDGKGACNCQGPFVFGATGANGASGAAGGTGLAQTGGTGSQGATGSSTPNSLSTGARFSSGSSCPVISGPNAGSAGSSGGAPGKAVNFGGLSVTVNNSGTIHGATS